MVLNLLLLGSVCCYVHISTEQANIMRYVRRAAVAVVVFFSNIFGFNRFRVQPSFAYTVHSIWQFPSHQIYGYTTNIRLLYDEHSATAAFRIKLHCICHCCRQNRSLVLQLISNFYVLCCAMCDCISWLDSSMCLAREKSHHIEKKECCSIRSLYHTTPYHIIRIHITPMEH